MENGARGRMLIGYMRVSTGEQSLDLQRDALARVGCERVYDDVCSGRAPDRPGLSKALEVAREGDALVVWKLDRIGRSLPHVVGLVGDLHKRATSREQGLVSVSCSAATQSPCATPSGAPADAKRGRGRGGDRVGTDGGLLAAPRWDAGCAQSAPRKLIRSCLSCGVRSFGSLVAGSMNVNRSS